jgi:putative acetyltransferase
VTAAADADAPDGIVIRAGDPSDPRVLALIAASDRYHAGLYPAESNHLLDAAALRAPNVRFLTACAGADIVGIGALLAMPSYGEVKRMWVDPAWRGCGLGRRILSAIEAAARGLGLPALRLETGIRQPEAIGLYRAHGFADIATFADYLPDPLSLFMQKDL